MVFNLNLMMEVLRPRGAMAPLVTAQDASNSCNRRIPAAVGAAQVLPTTTLTFLITNFLKYKFYYYKFSRGINLLNS